MRQHDETRKRDEVFQVRELTELLKRDGARTISKIAGRPETKPATPPDVLAENEAGQRIGVEVTQLSDSIVRNANAHIANGTLKDVPPPPTLPSGEPHPASQLLRAIAAWLPEELEREVQKTVAKKDRKPFDERDGPYAERWLLIWADDLWACDFGRFEVGSYTMPDVEQFDSIYLMTEIRPNDPVYWLLHSSAN